MVSKTSFADWPCTIARSLGVMGDAWSLLILRESFFFGATRFAEFEDGLMIPTNVLASRLKSLVADGILAKHEVRSGRWQHEYRPTVKGAELWPVISAISAWGNRWITDDQLDEIPLQHRECGNRVYSDRCNRCARRLGLDEVGFEPGPLLVVFADLFAQWSREEFDPAGSTALAVTLMRKLARSGCLIEDELMKMLRARKISDAAVGQLRALMAPERPTG